MENIGVYAVVNKVNGKKYIGHSSNLDKRRKTHMHNIRLCKSHNILLNRASQKYGPENFEFKVLMVCDTIEYAKLIEQKLIDINYGEYNISRTSSGGDCISNHPEIGKLKEKHRLNYKRLADENGGKHPFRKQSQKGEHNNNFKGWKTRTKCIDCGVQKRNNTKRCPECNKKFLQVRSKGENNGFYGKKHTLETVEYLKVKQRLRINDPDFVHPQAKAVIIDGVEYKSISEAGRIIGCGAPLILFRIKSKNKKFAGYFYKDEGSTTSESVASSDAKQEPPCPQGDDIV